MVGLWRIPPLSTRLSLEETAAHEPSIESSALARHASREVTDTWQRAELMQLALKTQFNTLLDHDPPQAVQGDSD